MPELSGTQRFPLHALLAGVIGGGLFTVAVTSLIGPVANDTPSEMAAALANGRTWALLAFFGAGLAAMLGLWFMAALRTWLRQVEPNNGEELGTVALAAMTLAIGLALTGIALFYGATYELASLGGSKALRGLVDAANGMMMMTKFAGAAVIASISLAMSRTNYAPRWFAVLGFLSVAALIGSSIGIFTEDSFTQFGGPLDFYGVLPAAVWSTILLALLGRTQS
jgi:hypothetical protein